MRRLLLLAAFACLCLPRLSHAAAVVWTCETARVTALDMGYLATTTCVSDAGDYTAGGNFVGVGGAATVAGAGAVLCGSSARIPRFVLSGMGTIAGAGAGNPTWYDLTNYKLKVFEGAAGGVILTEKTGAEAMVASTTVYLVTLCS